MPKQYGYSFTLAALTALTIGFAFQADAGFLVFTNRDVWQSALGGADLEYNFNGFTSDASFAVGAINFGPFKLSPIGVPPPGSDQIHGDSGLDQGLDGTPYASMFLDSTRSVALTFSRLAIGFGADFADGAAINFGVFQPGARSPVILGGPPTNDNQFFGIISTDPFDRIDFLFNGPTNSNATVRFDNLAIGSAVPEPSSLVMLIGMGAVLLTACGCWRVRRAKIEVGPDKT